MYTTLKKAAAILISTWLVLTCTVSVFAAESLKINDKTDAAVGDTVNYTLNLSDCKDKLEGIQMYVTYDKNYLKIDGDSLKFDNLDSVISNTKLDGYMTFNWTNVQNLVSFSSKKALMSVNFEVLKSGSTDIKCFVKEMYGDDMTYFKSYKMTTDISVNGTVTSKDQTPIITDDESFVNNHQGGFVNYEDGMGEENTPNSSNHKAVTGDAKKGTQYVTYVQDVTKTVSATGTNNSNTTIFVVAAIVIILAAIVVIAIRKRKSDKSHSNDVVQVSSDLSNNENNDNENN